MTKRELMLKLTPEQQKMVVEKTGVQCDHWRVDINIAKLPLYSVVILPDPGKNIKGETGKNITGDTGKNITQLRLTAPQKRAIKSVFGVSCEAVEITKELIDKIGKC